MKTVLFWLKNYWSFGLLLAILAFNIFNVIAKDYVFGQRFFPTVLLGLALLPIVLGLYKKKRELVRFETFLLFMFLALYALAYFGTTTRNYGFSELIVLISCIAVYLSLAHGFSPLKDPVQGENSSIAHRVSSSHAHDPSARSAHDFSPAEHTLRNFLLKGIILSGLISTLFGYFYFFTRPAARFYGTFLNYGTVSDNWPNAFALFMLMVWPIGVYFCMKEPMKDTVSSQNYGHKSFLKKWQPEKGILMVILISGLILTFSRAAFLVMIVQAIFLCIALCSKKDTFKDCPPASVIIKRFSFIFVLIILLVTVSQGIRARTKPTVDLTERATFQTREGATSIRERLEFWSGGASLAFKAPLLGHGPSSFRFTYPEIQKTFLATSDHPHNMFIKIAAEAGIPAMLTLILFFIWIAWTVLKRIRYLENDDRILALTLIASVAGAILHNLVDYNFNFIANILLFWILLALLRSLVAFSHLQKESRLRAVAIIAGILFLNSMLEGGLLYFKTKAHEAEAAYNYTKADEYFEYYESSSFLREHFIERAEIFKAEENIDLAELVLNMHLEYNMIDSEAWHKLGEIQHLQEKYHEALESFRTAIFLNPKNHFWYYWNFIDTARKLNAKEEIDAMFVQVLPLLEQYEAKLRSNIHYTAQTPNAEASVRLYELLAEIYPDKSEEFLRRAREYEEFL